MGLGRGIRWALPTTLGDLARDVHKGSPGDERGVTMVEILATLAIAGMLTAAVATSVTSTLARWRVHESSISLAAALRAARVKAIFDHAETSVTFDTTRDRYAIATTGAAGGVIYDDSEKTFLVELPKTVSFVRPDAGPTITLIRPSTYDEVAVFSSKGRTLSTTTPGYVFLGNVNQEVYYRLEVGIAGTVGVTRWNGTDWQD